MATRVEELITRVRDILSDPGADRYSHEILMRYLASGVNDFLLRTTCSKSILYIALENNVAVYKIQDYSQKILRVEFKGKALVVKTSTDMDAINSSWQDEEALEPRYVVFDNLPLGAFRIYPKVTSSGIIPVTANSPYGGLIDIDATDELFNLPSAEDIEQTIPEYFTVVYVKKQTPIALDSSLFIDSMYDDALVYYVSGMALRADADTQNRAFGNEQINMYDSYVRLASVNESLNNNTLTPRTTEYKGFV